MSSQDAKRAIKNTFFLFIRMVIVLLIGLYTSRVILRVLGFDDFGIYNVVGSVVIFFSFLNNALTNATSRFLTYELGCRNNEGLKTTYSTSITLHIVLAVVLLIILEAGGVWFVNNELNISANRMRAVNWCFQFSLFTFCIGVIKVPFNSTIIAYEKMNFFALVTIVEKLLQLVVVFVISRSSIDKLVCYSLLLFLVALFILVLNIVYCRATFKNCSYEISWNRNLIRKFVSYSGYSMLVNCADIISVQSRNVFFNWFVGTLANAALGVANQVISLFNMFVDNFSKAFQPQIIKSYAANDKSYFMNLLFSSSKINYYMILFISIPIILNIDYLLNVWLDDYPELTVPFIKAIVIYTMIDSFQQPLWTAVHATGILKVHQIMIASIKILSIPLTYLLLYLGYSSVLTLYLWSALNLICAFARTLYLRKLISLPLGRYLKDVIIRIVLVTMLVLPISFIFSEVFINGFSHLIITSFISSAILLLSVFFIGINYNERRFLINMISNKIHNF